MLKREQMIEVVTNYFSAVDRFDTDAIMAHLHESIVLEVPSHGVCKNGNGEVRQTYLNRAKTVKESWHGDFDFIVDEAAGRVAVRLTVRRVNLDGTKAELDNLTLIRFDGEKIANIAVWMSGENSLT